MDDYEISVAGYEDFWSDFYPLKKRANEDAVELLEYDTPQSLYIPPAGGQIGGLANIDSRLRMIHSGRTNKRPNWLVYLHPNCIGKGSSWRPWPDEMPSDVPTMYRHTVPGVYDENPKFWAYQSSYKIMWNFAVEGWPDLSCVKPPRHFHRFTNWRSNTDDCNWDVFDCGDTIPWRCGFLTWDMWLMSSYGPGEKIDKRILLFFTNKHVGATSNPMILMTPELFHRHQPTLGTVNKYVFEVTCLNGWYPILDEGSCNLLSCILRQCVCSDCGRVQEISPLEYDDWSAFVAGAGSVCTGVCPSCGGAMQPGHCFADPCFIAPLFRLRIWRCEADNPTQTIDFTEPYYDTGFLVIDRVTSGAPDMPRWSQWVNNFAHYTHDHYRNPTSSTDECDRVKARLYMDYILHDPIQYTEHDNYTFAGAGPPSWCKYSSYIRDGMVHGGSRTPLGQWFTRTDVDWTEIDPAIDPTDDGVVP